MTWSCWRCSSPTSMRRSPTTSPAPATPAISACRTSGRPPGSSSRAWAIPSRVTFVPGNHDAYVRGSLEGLLREIAPVDPRRRRPRGRLSLSAPLRAHRHRRPVLGHPDPSLRRLRPGRVEADQGRRADPRRSRARSGLLPDRPHPPPAACRRGRGRAQSHRRTPLREDAGPGRRRTRAPRPQPRGLARSSRRPARPHPGDRRPLRLGPRAAR